MNQINQKMGKYRWVIATLLLFATTINYMDRQVISYLKEFFCSPVTKGGFGWTNTDFAFITSFFYRILCRNDHNCRLGN